MRWFEQHLPADGSVSIHRYDMGLVGLSIAGPKSRDVLQAMTDEDVSNAAFKFMDHRAMDIANCPALINRVTYTGDLGYEIWVAPDYQRRLYDAIMKAGKRTRDRQFRHAGAAVDAPRKEFSHLVSRTPSHLWRV